jgi:hypothetical protein
LAAPAFAYRTAGELPEFEGTARVRWAEPVIAYRMLNQVPSGMALDDVAKNIEAAFSVWSQADCGQVTFHNEGVTGSSAAPGDGVSTIEWVLTGWSDRGFESAAAAITDVQYAKQDDEWVIVEADLYVNADDHEWASPGFSDEGEPALWNVFVHEGGHMLGLMHPCEAGGEDGAPACKSTPEAEGTVMHPEYQPEQTTLAEDDVAGACFLYPGQRCEVTGCGPGEVCTDDGCRAECDDTTCAEGEACVDGECRSSQAICESPGCGECEADADCPRDMTCHEGACSYGTAPLGDPCAESSECETGSCASDGYCARQCVADEDCDAGDACEDGACVGALAPFGAECSEAADCLGDQCLAGLTSSPVCTRLCGRPSDPSCPLGWTCDVVEERAVCRPPEEAVGCGCETVVSNGSGSLSFAWIPFLTFVGLYARRTFRLRRAAPASA